MKQKPKTIQRRRPQPSQTGQRKKVSNAIEITVNSKKIYESELTAQNLSRYSGHYVPFFEDKDKYLQFLYFAAKTSGTHSACVAAKTSFTYGAGVKALQSGTENTEATAKLKTWLDSVNGKRTKNGKEIKNGIADYYRTGNAFFERAEKDGVVNIYHISTKKARIKKDYSGVLVSANFYEGAYLAGDARYLPFFPNQEKDDDGVLRSVIHVCGDKISNEYYGEPDIVSALIDMEIEYRIGSYNKAEFDNGFKPSTLMQFVGDYETEEATEYLTEMKSKFTGDGNNGKMVLQVVPSKELFANLLTLNANTDGNFSELSARVETNILKAHRLPKVLAGIPIAGKLGGDTKEIQTAYNYCLSTVIYPIQSELLTQLSEPFFNFVCGTGFGYEVIDSPPITLSDSIEGQSVLTINEQRAAIGYEPITGGDILGYALGIDFAKILQPADVPTDTKIKENQ